MAGSGSWNKIVGAFGLCLIALFSSVLPSFLGSFHIEVKKINVRATVFSAVLKKSPGQTVIDPDWVMYSSAEPVTVMHQAWVTCPPPAETDVHPTGTRWGRGMGAQFPRVKTEGHKPSKGEQMPNKKNPLELRVLVLSWITHWLAIYDTFRIVIFLYSMRLAFRSSELSWGFSILPNIVDSKFVFLQTCLSHTSASSEGWSSQL